MDGDDIFRFLRWHRRRRNNDDNNDDNNEASDEEEMEDENGEEAEAAGNTDRKSSTSLVTEITFDKSLPRSHAYLGSDLEDIQGRTIHDDDSLITLPILSLPGVVLLPGQILPLYLFQPSAVAMVKQVLERDRTFGYIAAVNSFDSDMPKIGITAEVLAVKEDFHDLSGVSTTKVKAIGRQRFRVFRIKRQLDGILTADVKILPEKIMPEALEGAVTNACRRMCVYEERGKLLDRNKQKIAVANSCCTQWPSWVYRQYDIHYVMSLVKQELVSWNETFSFETMPNDPDDFSYWVARSLPFEDAMKLRLLAFDTAIQRLRCEYSIMSRCTVMCCKRCNNIITHKTDVFSMSVDGPLGAYVNPGGYVHETLTVGQTTGLRLIGRPSEESSWFPGYAWTIAQCRQCSSHMGWRFTVAGGRDLKPDKFWGLCRSSLKPTINVQAESEEDTSWLM